MTMDSVVIAIATFLGPVFAVQAQKWIEGWRADRDRRLEVFKTLMATRGSVLSAPHVEALNQIDLEFPDGEYHQVREAWRTYLDHLNSSPGASPTTWSEKSLDLFIQLLSAMGTALGYRFGQVDLKKGAYAPIVHHTDEAAQRELRTRALELLSGKSPLQTHEGRLKVDLKGEVRSE
jgi:hypothetical protein